MKTKIAIVGASGYSGEVLVSLLLRHPHAELVAVTSRQQAGRSLAEVYPQFAHLETARTLSFSAPDVDRLAGEAAVVFLALPHGVAAEYAVPLLAKGCRLVDLSADFRLRDPAVYREFYGHDHPAPDLLGEAVYGLPEADREAVRSARLVASPGCYPTSILIPLIPLLRAGCIEPSFIIADSLSGVSGAGRKAEMPYLFVECNESLRPYGVPRHRHLSEIEQELSRAAGRSVTVQFTPHLVPVNRGILTTLYLAPGESFSAGEEGEGMEVRLASLYEEAYGQEPFVRLLQGGALPDTKHVVGTNMIDLAWRLDPRTGRLIVMSAEDNLLKGASGQAVQSFNLMCGFPETAGLL